MLAKQRELEQGHSSTTTTTIKNLIDGTFAYSTTTTNDIDVSAMKRREDPTPLMNQHELSSAHRYQHYILLPAIQPIHHHYGSHIDPHYPSSSSNNQSNNNNNNYLLGSNNLCDMYLSHSRSSSMMDQQQQSSYSYNITSYSTDTSSLSTPIVSPTHSYLDNNQLPSYYS